MQVIITRSKMDDGRYRALFRSEFSVKEKEKLATAEKLALARMPDHCYYTVLELSEHDGHAPAWPDMDAMQPYIDRVKADIQKVCLGAGVKVIFTVKDTEGHEDVLSDD